MRRLSLLALVCIILATSMFVPRTATHANQADREAAGSQANGPGAPGLAAPPEIFASPQQVGPGGALYLDINAPASANIAYQVLLNGAFLIGGTLPANGVAHLSAAVPTVAAGQRSVTLQVYAGPGTWNTIATTALTILAPLQVSLSRASGPPGTAVNVTVNGALPGGSIRIDYANQPTGSPVPVQGSGPYQFTVPGDRPSPLGTATQVRAVQIVNGAALNSGAAAFQSQAPPNQPPYTVTDLAVPTTALQTGKPFIVQGQLSRALSGPASDYRLTPFWKTVDDEVFPLEVTQQTIQANGAFTLEVVAPSLLHGDPEPLAGGSALAIAINTPINDAASDFEPILADVPPPLVIKALDATTRQPLKAKVVIGALPDEVCHEAREFAAEAPALARVPIGQEMLGSTQLTRINEEWGLFEGGWSPGVQGDRSNAKLTDLTGQATFNLLSEIPLLNAAPYGSFAGLDLGGAPRPAAPRANSARPDGEVCLETVKNLYPVSVKVSGIFPDGQGGAYIYEDRLLYVAYSAEQKKYIYNNTPLNGPLEVLMTRVPWEYTGIEDLTYSATPLKYVKYDESKDKTYFAPYFAAGVSISNLASIPGTPIDASGVSTAPFEIRYEVAVEDLADIDVNTATFFFNGVSRDAVMETSGGVTSFSLLIDDPYRTLQPDPQTMKLTVRLEINTTLNKPPLPPFSYTQKEHLEIKFGKLPFWFTQATTTDRSVALADDTIQATLRGTTNGSGKELDSPDLEMVGQLNNDAGVGPQAMEVMIDATGWRTTKLDAATSATTINNPGTPGQLPSGSAGDTTVYFRTCANTIICPDNNEAEKITLVDTGWVPAYRNSWGIWPIASATVGVDTWFKGELESSGFLSFDEDGIAASQLKIKPTATVGVQAWLDLSILLGLVEASITARPTISMSLGLIINDFHKAPPSFALDGVHFGYRLDLDWYGKVGICPACDEEGGTQNIFAGSVNVPTRPDFGRAAAGSPTDTPPPNPAPAIAADGFGNTLTVWRSASAFGAGALLSSTGDGITAAAPQTVTTGLLIGPPAMAFYAPKAAMAVWPHTALATPGQVSTATLTETARSMHLRYSLWNGASWSAPQPLTAANTGDGSVTLAACPSTTAGCPAGGAITAAWIHDSAGELAQRRFKINYRVWANGAWGPVQVLDPASAATDSQPQLVYHNGLATLAWIRDTDRNLGTISDRRLMTLLLDGASAPAVVTSVPAGVVEFSYARASDGNPKIVFTLNDSRQPGLIGNNHYLHSASFSRGTWSVGKMLDKHGRPIRGERPNLIVDKDNHLSVVFRGLGFGRDGAGAWRAYDEPIGMQTGLGELLSLSYDPGNPVNDPQYLTTDGAVNWQPAAVFDPQINGARIAVGRGAAPAMQAGPSALVTPTVRLMSPAVDGAVAVAALPSLPDFRAESLSVSERYPEASAPIQATFVVRNLGASWVAGAAPVRVAATWDGPYGSAVPAATATITPSLRAGQSITVTLALNAPATVNREHKLHVTVNPLLEINELPAANNALQVAVGGLPAPLQAAAAARRGSRFVVFDWEPSEDSRVYGYRIYRAEGAGPLQPIGSTLTNGYVDVTAQAGRRYRYAITAYGGGVESPPTLLPAVETTQFDQIFPLIRR